MTKIIERLVTFFRRNTSKHVKPAKPVEREYGPYFAELPENPSPHTIDQDRRARESLERTFGPDSILPDLWLDRCGR